MASARPQRKKRVDPWQILSGLLSIITVTLLVLSYKNDRATLQLAISTDQPVFRINNSGHWSHDSYKKPLTEQIQAEMATLLIPYLQEHRLLTPGSVTKLQLKAQQNRETLDTLEVSIPIHLTISNNGAQPTTIVDAKITLHGFYNEPHTQVIDKFRLHIDKRKVVDHRLAVSSNWPNIPPAIVSELVPTIFAEVAKPTSDEDKKMISEISKMIANAMRGPNSRNLPVHIDVELTDQFGEKVRASTGFTYRLPLNEVKTTK